MPPPQTTWRNWYCVWSRAALLCPRSTTTPLWTALYVWSIRSGQPSRCPHNAAHLPARIRWRLAGLQPLRVLYKGMPGLALGLTGSGCHGSRRFSWHVDGLEPLSCLADSRTCPCCDARCDDIASAPSATHGHEASLATSRAGEVLHSSSLSPGFVERMAKY